MSIRDERAAALIRRHRDLSDDFTRALPGLLDDLEAIDASHGPADDAWSDLQVAAWIERNPAKFEAWVRKQNRINGAPPPFAAPAKPATRRRTTR